MIKRKKFIGIFIVTFCLFVLGVPVIVYALIDEPQQRQSKTVQYYLKYVNQNNILKYSILRGMWRSKVL